MCPGSDCVSSNFVAGYISNKKIKSSSFKGSENIQKKEGGADSTVSNNQFFSVTLNELSMNARKRAYYNIEFQRGSQSKDCCKPKRCQNKFPFCFK